MLWLLVLLVGILSLLYFFYNRLLFDEEFEKIPGPKGILFFGNTFDFVMDSETLFNYLRILAGTYKDLYKIKVGLMKHVILHNPEDVEILLTNTKYNKKGYFYFPLRPWLNDGLLISSGEKWYERRKMITPAFHFNILRHFSTILIENTEKFIASLEFEVGKQKTDIYPFITNMTLNSICETAMGTQLDEETSDIGKRYKDAINTLGTYIIYRGQRVWFHLDFLFNLSSVGRKQKNLLNLLEAFRDRVIKRRRDNGNHKNLYAEVMKDPEDIYGDKKKRLAMLDLLLGIEEQGKIDSAGINEEVDTFMFEGHDTSSTALLFTLMLLANHQEEQNKVFEECFQIFGTSKRIATMSDLAEMKYLECCIKESLRLYPPVSIISRFCDDPLNLKNYKCSSGIDCAIFIFDLHRRSDQFVEPMRFRPERFMEEPTWHPFAYIPFSAGPRNCIGQRFAMMEMKIVLSAVLRKYRLLPVTKPEDISFVVDIILRPKDPIYVKFEDRYKR